MKHEETKQMSILPPRSSISEDFWGHNILTEVNPLSSKIHKSIKRKPIGLKMPQVFFGAKKMVSKIFCRPSDPWSTDRYARFLVGLCICICLLLHHSLYWVSVAGLAFISLNLIVTSFTGYCIFHRILLRLGAKDREDLFEPGGKARELKKLDVDLERRSCD